MVFVSLEYGLLLAATLLAYWVLPARLALWVLLAASVTFYAWWSVPHLALVGGSIAVGFCCALVVEGSRRRGRALKGRLAVGFAVVVLLALLAWFKYADFLLELIAPLVGTHGPLDIALPIAISFYTFQILAYVIDVGRGDVGRGDVGRGDVGRGTEAERSALRFAVFIGFFPQLIAGPIVRAQQLLPQLVRRAPFDPRRFVSGLELTAYGLVKKSVFADNLAVYVDRVFGSPELAGGLDIALATLAFGAQIYCDFSGYTDIARGSARLLSIELPVNFRTPYLATSLTDFWRRWHITLSTWLRDYLYIALGGNRVGRSRLLANLFLTMLLGGLWHGASATFVLWGAYHGLLLVVERTLGVARRGRARTRWLAIPVTFALVQVGWLIFRAESFATLSTLALRVSELPLAANPWFRSAEYAPLVLAVYVLHALSAWARRRPAAPPLLERLSFAIPALAGAVLLVTVFGGSSDAFIYFQF